MIRLLLGLGVVLFLGLWFLGADHGQYINPPRPQDAAVAAVEAPKRTVFVPAPPVAGAQAQGEPTTPAQPTTLPTALTASQPAVATRLMHAPVGATVRGGPGAEFPVVGSVGAGDGVLVVDDTSAPGWIRIAVDGSGQGWVAASLLRE